MVRKPSSSQARDEALFQNSNQVLRRVGGRRICPNMAIHGENLAALGALKNRLGSGLELDVIAIDPPYNVGGEQGYRNIWRGKSAGNREWAGQHGAFLDLMEPRLKAARELLAEDGILFINICDEEYARLKILADQIFGEENNLGTIIWNKVQGAYGKHLTDVHEYVLVYARNAAAAPRLCKQKESALSMLAKAEQLRKAEIPHRIAKKLFKEWIRQSLSAGAIGKSESFYDQLHPKTFEPFQATSMSAQDSPNSRYHGALKHPVTGKLCKVPPMGWKYSKQTLEEMSRHTHYCEADGFVIAGEIRYGVDETTIPRQAFQLREGLVHALPSVITIPHNQGKKDLPAGIQFTTPKPVRLLKELIRSYPKSDARVMDFFGGSGTTAHAVLELNKEDGGNRSWILIEEMKSTFENVLLPRISAVDAEKNFTVYRLEQAAGRSASEDVSLPSESA